MNDFYNDRMKSLNEAVEIEQGNVKGRQTVYQIDPVKSFAKEEIRQIRKDAGMTQAVFANYMGVSQKTVEAWEKGTNHPTGCACRLLEILNAKVFEAMPFIKHLPHAKQGIE